MNEKVKELDDQKRSSIKAEYYKEILTTKTKSLLFKIKKLKK